MKRLAAAMLAAFLIASPGGFLWADHEEDDEEEVSELAQLRAWAYQHFVANGRRMGYPDAVIQSVTPPLVEQFLYVYVQFRRAGYVPVLAFQMAYAHVAAAVERMIQEERGFSGGGGSGVWSSRNPEGEYCTYSRGGTICGLR